MTAAIPGREELAVNCLRRLARANIDNQVQRDLAGADIKSTLEKIDRLAAKPADAGCQKALRRLAIVQRPRMTYGGTVHVSWVCKTCDSDWDRDAPEKHKSDCPASTTGEPKR